MRVRFLRPASVEVDEAVTYFDEQREGLGDRFERDLQEAIAFSTAHPSSGKPLSRRTRKLRLRTFPYDVIDVAEPDELIVVAIAHHRRRPGYWLNRLSPTM